MTYFMDAKTIPLSWSSSAHISLAQLNGNMKGLWDEKRDENKRKCCSLAYIRSTRNVWKQIQFNESIESMEPGNTHNMRKTWVL